MLLELKTVALCVDVYGLSHHYLNECDDDVGMHCSESGKKPYAPSGENSVRQSEIQFKAVLILPDVNS